MFPKTLLFGRWKFVQEYQIWPATLEPNKPNPVIPEIRQTCDGSLESTRVEKVKLVKRKRAKNFYLLSVPSPRIWVHVAKVPIASEKLRHMKIPFMQNQNLEEIHLFFFHIDNLKGHKVRSPVPVLKLDKCIDSVYSLAVIGQDWDFTQCCSYLLT